MAGIGTKLPGNSSPGRLDYEVHEALADLRIRRARSLVDVARLEAGSLRRVRSYPEEGRLEHDGRAVREMLLHPAVRVGRPREGGAQFMTSAQFIVCVVWVLVNVLAVPAYLRYLGRRDSQERTPNA
jgi:hypothetical protein